jgi:hypothetical protein
LNFDTTGAYVLKINVGMAHQIVSSEEAFARIFYDVEQFSVPVYHDMAHAIIASIALQMRLVLGSYMDNLHDNIIARSVWLSRIQGFYAWGVGQYDEETQQWDKFDGLSGNQANFSCTKHT